MNKYRIRIVRDEMCQNPRNEWDHLETIYYLDTSRYCLGDKAVSDSEMQGMADDEDLIKAPVYAYVHSGAVLSLGAFSCPWDSGISGLIVMPKSANREGGWNLPESDFETLVREKIFPAAIEEWNDIASGNVWGFVVEEKTCEKCGTWDEVESCWGFVGDVSKEGMWETFAHEGITREMFDEAWEDRE